MWPGTEAERWNMRMTTPMWVMPEFYDAFSPRLEEAIDYCDKFSDASPAR